MPKVSFVSLGCNKNLVDTEVMMGLLAKAGFEIIGQEDAADVLLVNTCGFINDAKEESIHTIIQLAQYKKTGSCKALIVTGCLAQRYKDELLKEIPEIDGLVGTGEIDRIVEAVRGAIDGERKNIVSGRSFIYDHQLPRWRTTPSHYAYIKIAEGCDNRCSYCVIPDIRGGYRSRPKESILREAQDLVEQGVKEINITAQDSTRYGIDLYGRYALAELVQEMEQIPGLQWVRLLYAYPTRITEELIEVLKTGSKLCKYLDMPIQHVDKELLARMNRQGDREMLLSLIKRLRREVPGITLRTTLIVGFPGETEAQFQSLLEFVKEAEFDRLGAFTYSQEENTPAGRMREQIPEDVKNQRRNLIMQVQQEISLKKNRNKIGSIISVLVEGKSVESQELYVGRSGADAPDIDGTVVFTGASLNPGDMVRVRITDAAEYDLMGEVLE